MAIDSPLGFKRSRNVRAGDDSRSRNPRFLEELEEAPSSRLREDSSKKQVADSPVVETVPQVRDDTSTRDPLDGFRNGSSAKSSYFRSSSLASFRLALTTGKLISKLFETLDSRKRNFRLISAGKCRRMQIRANVPEFPGPCHSAGFINNARIRLPLAAKRLVIPISIFGEYVILLSKQSSGGWYRSATAPEF